MGYDIGSFKLTYIHTATKTFIRDISVCIMFILIFCLFYGYDCVSNFVVVTQVGKGYTVQICRSQSFCI